MFRTRVVASAAVLSILVAACGARVVPLAQDQTGIVNPTAGPQTTTGGTDGGTAAGGTGTATGTTTGQTTGGTGVVDTGPILGGQDDCRATRATDRGVSATTIKLGLIASINGPLRGQFNSAVEAVDAYFRGLNERGGICGRRVQLIIKDDNGSGQNNLAIAERMATEDKVFAFVGSHSAPDDSGIAEVSKKHRIPDIGFALTWKRAESPYTYGAPGQLQRTTIGEGASGSMYLNRVNKIKQIAIFWLKESEVSFLNAWAFESAMMRVTKRETGTPIRVCHEQPAGVLDNNYTNYVVSMKGNCDPADGPIAVYSTMENNANIKLAKAMKAQNFKYTVYAPTFTSYQRSFIEQSSGAAEGAYIAMPQIPFERLERPQSEWSKGTLELKRYVDTLKRFFPRHAPAGSFGGPAWAQAELFTQAARACGAELTRRCLFRELDTMGPFSANGFVSPVRPGAHHIYTADLIVQVRNGRFVEIRPNDRSGPKEAPDFWDTSTLINWRDFYCANKNLYPNTAEKDRYIECG